MNKEQFEQAVDALIEAALDDKELDRLVDEHMRQHPPQFHKTPVEQSFGGLQAKSEMWLAAALALGVPASYVLIYLLNLTAK